MFGREKRPLSIKKRVFRGSCFTIATTVRLLTGDCILLIMMLYPFRRAGMRAGMGI